MFVPINLQILSNGFSPMAVNIKKVSTSILMSCAKSLKIKCFYHEHLTS